jgi:hypothetical protein
LTSRAIAALGLSLGLVSTAARADPPPAVDVVVKDTPPPRRPLTLEWNPLGLLISRISVNVEISPADHHAIVLSPFYFYARTASFSQPADASGATVEVPAEKFEGFGGEIGYRYYTGRGGPRGAYLGPSVFAAFPNATVQTAGGASAGFTDIGVAADVGYQALVAANWVVSLGVGAQYTFVTKSFPDEQLPARIYANRGVLPRLNASIGYAF